MKLSAGEIFNIRILYVISFWSFFPNRINVLRFVNLKIITFCTPIYFRHKLNIIITNINVMIHRCSPYSRMHKTNTSKKTTGCAFFRTISNNISVYHNIINMAHFNSNTSYIACDMVCIYIQRIYFIISNNKV